ncbi:MAG: CsbD family protein [Steroidobacteraceae bacterium]
MEDQIKGSIKDITGKVQDAVGGSTADPGLQLKSKVKQASRQFQQMYGAAIDSFRATAIGNPVIALAVAGGVGFVLGALWARRD